MVSSECHVVVISAVLWPVVLLCLQVCGSVQGLFLAELCS